MKNTRSGDRVDSLFASAGAGERLRRLHVQVSAGVLSGRECLWTARLAAIPGVMSASRRSAQLLGKIVLAALGLEGDTGAERRAEMSPGTTAKWATVSPSSIIFAGCSCSWLNPLVGDRADAVQGEQIRSNCCDVWPQGFNSHAFFGVPQLCCSQGPRGRDGWGLSRGAGGLLGLEPRGGRDDRRGITPGQIDSFLAVRLVASAVGLSLGATLCSCFASSSLGIGR